MEDQDSSATKWIAVSIIGAGVLISGALVFTSGKSGNIPTNTGNNVPAQQQNNNQRATNPTGPVKVSIDDDPVLGDKNAPVALIEFSDYECPFCKRHFDQVYPQLKKEYIDTGKVKLVFRDFIAVPSHNPLATSEAMAAQCARDQGGDPAYYKYHDEIFKRTTSNGNGLAVTQLPVIAKDLGLNVAQFQQCLNSGKYEDEITKDMTDGSSAGVNGTPTFFVGKSSSNGVMEGTIIEGAQPFSAFKVIIDEMLK